jgi:hypothetical protein
LLDRRAGGALGIIAAKRLAGDLTTPKFTVLTVGVLAAPSLDEDCALGEFTMRGSEFDGFTFGTWFSAGMALLRLQNNSISNVVAGLWLEVPDAGDPVKVVQGTSIYYKSMLLFEEYQLLVGLSSVFPRPTRPSFLIRRITTEVAAHVVTKIPHLPYSILVSGNQVDVRRQSQTAGASAAMRLALYREQSPQFLTSVILSSNRLCGGMAGYSRFTGEEAIAGLSRFTGEEAIAGLSRFTGEEGTPAALMTLTGATPCSITGNVVINSGASADMSRAPSLWLVISDSSGGTEQLAVTGNVLQGRSDLALMKRYRGVGPLETWSPVNADPA